MSLNNNKRIDLWELTGRAFFDLAKYAITAICFGAVLQKDQKPIAELILIALGIAAVCVAIAVVCFAVYNRNLNNN